MSAAITTESTTLENQLTEVLAYLEAKQVATASNPDGVTIIGSKTVNNLTNIMTVSLSIPIEDAVTGGNQVISAKEVYL